ncbi:MAG: glycoside hydrolase family 2 protein, partial [Lachnospiraceae bacterium]|nr:glycoside hydrolase family 2 protein [Lachnospiraceae bacterium]
MERISLNDDWEYFEQFTEGLITKNPRTKASKVRIPHTVSITPFNYFNVHDYQKECAYVKSLEIPKDMKGKRIFISFDGVAHSAYVYVNGSLMGEHHSGYTAFSVEITSALNYGEVNRIVVKVDSREAQNIPPFGYVIDYMTYGGIYREVNLIVKDEIYMKDVFARPMIPTGEVLPGEFKNSESMGAKLKKFKFDGTLAIKVTLDGLDDASRNSANYRVKLYDAKTDELVLDEEVSSSAQDDVLENVTIHNIPTEHADTSSSYDIYLDVKGVKLWDTVVPNRYRLELSLLKGNQVTDSFSQTIGFRRVEFKTDGLYLNGRHLKLRGLNRHQSYPYVGYAMPKSMQRLDADILRFELGVNAVRTSHYPQSKHFIERCNELGLLVFTEIPGWQHIGDEDWKNQAVENVKEMVTQYRNEPSIILWGVRINESQDDDEFYLRTNELAHALDDTRPTGGVRYLKKSSLLEDVYTYNDFSHDGSSISKCCDKKSQVTPDMNKPYLISEYNGHMYPTKSYDDEEHRLTHALRHAEVINSVNKESDILGAFAWCMFDYNTHKDFGSGDMICYHGVLDMFRNPKMAAYVYASQQNRTP